MSYKFGKTSQARLDTCHPILQELANEVIKHIDFTVVCGHRDEEGQNEAVANKASKVNFPNSKHNSLPSIAIDVAPYPIDWDDIKRFAFLVGIFKGVAIAKGYKIRLGSDWDSDGDITDQKFMDWPHIELVLED
tara:strand:- start:590 stop:991 length:402 start_codon:yes stop_codon:yes gene_type:complete